MKKLFFLIIAGALLAGCASKPYESNPKYSFALNVMKATGSTEIKDSRSEEEATKIRDGGPTVAGTVGYGIIGALSNPGSGLGIGSVMDGLLHGGAGLAVANPKAPENYPHLYAWMPKEMASSPNEAMGKLEQLLADALSKALNEVDFPEDYVVGNVTTDHPNYLYSVVAEIKGGGCGGAGELICRYRISYDREYNPGIIKTPDFLQHNGELSWDLRRGFSVGGSSFYNIFKSGSVPEARLPDLEVYTRMTAYLPDWVFMYFSPRKVRAGESFMVSVRTEDGFAPLGKSVILNKGQIHLFVKPNI